jgi:alkylation response protein AidB-like acyl-CoA dehydrogenase
MNFEFSEEQTMIKDSVSRFVREQYDFDTRRGIIESDDGISREFWSMFAELGWLSVPFAEEYGGFGGTVVDIAAVMEKWVKALWLSLIHPQWLFLAVYCPLRPIQP